MKADLISTLRAGAFELRKEVLQEGAEKIMSELGAQRPDCAEKAARTLIEDLDRIYEAEMYLHAQTGVMNGT